MKKRDKVKEVELALDGVELTPVQGNGDLFTLDDFIEMCEEGHLIDYDGGGHYATATHEAVYLYAKPSEIKKGEVDRRFTHVMWYNR